MRSTRVSDTHSARRVAPGKRRLRLLLWVAACSLLVGIAQLGQPLEDFLRDTRNLAHKEPASGNLVVVGIDDRSLEQVGKWPWPRRHHASLVANLRRAGAKEIFFDIDFSFAGEPQDDEAFQKILAEGEGDVLLPARVVVDAHTGKQADLLPIEAFRNEAELVSINAIYNFRGEFRKLPYRFGVSGRAYPSLAARAAHVSGPAGESFPIDFSIDPRSLPILSAADVLRGGTAGHGLAGKTVLIGTTSARLGDMWLVPGYGVMSGVFLQALGAETLLAGKPVEIGWLLPFLLGFAIAAGLLLLKDLRVAAAGMAAAAAVFLFAPIVLEDRLIFVDVVPSVLFLLVMSGFLTWASLKRFYSARGNINAISGLPNLNVLREQEADRAAGLVVAKVHNYAEIASALSSEGEQTLVRQIAHRLKLISLGSTLYQSDEGIFAWFADQDTSAAPGEHLNAAFEIFRSPLLVLGSQIDTTITFGIDMRAEEPLAGRLGSSLVAADKALREGLKWKQYDPSESEDIVWKLSLLSQLDQAIDSGELWIAFQPKMDVANGTIVGAEALARWNHPEKGPINPVDFILAAEQSGRIAKLTDYVLDRSIEAAAQLNQQCKPFNIAVNLSARLIDGMALTDTVARLLTRHRLPAEFLTLEITETAALAGAGGDLQVLKDLRGMGVQLSIDDYGTGLSTLDYMKRIPATEIKIDKSFIDAIEKSRSDRLMVHSTIQLAHSLGQKVVAEGVERPATLEMLAVMGCDIAQGFLIGRPQPLEELEQLLGKGRRAA
ncbi:MAG TPA: EAL domain-containing protein [Allosphingosinicella sp.]|nr:EAL domain-containing protein [Allosphingosinicella sp.]